MNTCPEQIVHYMHDYLDGDLDHDNEQILKQHLQKCPSCQELMDGLTEAVQFIEQAEPVKAPVGFVDNVMVRLPKEKKQVGIQKWLRRHPFLAAAAMFVMLMSASLFAGYGNDQQFSVTNQPNLIVEGETVIVPAGEVIEGDLIVKNGELRIEGEVNGNVTVIRGSKYMASTAVITGTSDEIDQAFDWLWYKIKQTVKDVFNISDSEQEIKE